MEQGARHLSGACGPRWPAWLAAVWLLFLACRPAAEVPAVRIGVIGPFSGPLVERVGSYVREGVELAVDEVEAGGGVHLAGRKLRIEVFYEDSRDRSEVAVEAARKLVHQDRVAALIGPCLSRTALEVAAFAEQNRIPMISPLSTHPELTVGKPYIFRVTIVDDLQARALARYTHEDLQARTAAVLYDVASAYNRNMAELFRQAFTAAGGRVVAFEDYTTGERDFRRLLIRVREATPDVLLLPNYVNEVPLQATQARELGLDVTLIGTDAWDTGAYPLLEVFDGSYFVGDWLPAATPGDHERQFLEKYARTFERPPTSPAALAYDAVGVLLAAIERSGSLEPEAVRQGIADLEAYRGVTGTLSFRGGGDPAKGIAVFAIRGGELHFVKWMQP